MWIKTISRVTRIIAILTLTLTLYEANGQRHSSINRFYIIEIDDKSDLLNSNEELRGSDPSLLFALKTNLLFDLLTAVNLEIEVPIFDSWSVAGEVIFPWWTMDNHRADSKRNRLQIINGTLEGRYWLGDRSTQQLLTGWFAGVYTGIGSYDIEHNKRGYQGDYIFTVGASGGYAHTINQEGTLRMEYSLGVGYMTTYYHRYEAEFCDNNHWHAVEKRSGHYKWFGPTRAKISLSWLIDYKLKR